MIRSDKTGTLTRGENTAVAVRLAGRDLHVEGVGYEPVGRILEDGEPKIRLIGVLRLRALLEASALCNDAALVPPGEDDPRWRALGDPTEAALLSLARKGGIDPEALRLLHQRTPNSSSVASTICTVATESQSS